MGEQTAELRDWKYNEADTFTGKVYSDQARRYKDGETIVTGRCFEIQRHRKNDVEPGESHAICEDATYLLKDDTRGD